MKKTALFILLSLICVVSSLHAQTFNLQTGREPVASLDGLWRFHTGDNPQWANPNFDDSQWRLLRSDKNWAEQGYKGYGGMAWYRFCIIIPGEFDHVSLLLPPLLSSYQVYANGSLIGSYGKMPPHPVPYVPSTAEYRLDQQKTSGPREVTIALRVWLTPEVAKYYGGGPQRSGGIVGETRLVHAHFERLTDSRLLRTGGMYSLGILECIAGIMALLLFLVRREETEYFWFGLSELVYAIESGSTIYANVHAVSIPHLSMWIDFLEAIAGVSYILLLQKLLLGRRSVLFSLAIAAEIAPFVINVPMRFQFSFGPGTVSLVHGAFSLVVFVWMCDLLVRRAKEGMRDARLLLAPVLMYAALEWIGLILYGSSLLGWQSVSIGDFSVFTHPFTVTAYDFVDVLFMLAMLAILASRFIRSRREEQRLAGEFEAARSVQSLLIPLVAPDTPGFSVESVYIPASEVGGDFFQILPGEDGSVLIVVGDVSGKGLKAAMTVSTIIGVLRGCTLRKPAEVLAYLNRVLHGQVSGFVTCCATLITSDGAMTLANAGNPAPYRNGREMAVAGGLPLGILAEGSYEESHYQLAAGDRLTFLSDGVVEATNEKRELFGFERTQQISIQPAAAIAHTAKAFGQQDDITVVTIERAVVPSLAVV